MTGDGHESQSCLQESFVIWLFPTHYPQRVTGTRGSTRYSMMMITAADFQNTWQSFEYDMALGKESCAEKHNLQDILSFGDIEGVEESKECDVDDDPTTLPNGNGIIEQIFEADKEKIDSEVASTEGECEKELLPTTLEVKGVKRWLRHQLEIKKTN